MRREAEPQKGGQRLSRSEASQAMMCALLSLTGDNDASTHYLIKLRLSEVLLQD